MFLKALQFLLFITKLDQILNFINKISEYLEIHEDLDILTFKKEIIIITLFVFSF